MPEKNPNPEANRDEQARHVKWVIRREPHTIRHLYAPKGREKGRGRSSQKWPGNSINIVTMSKTQGVEVDEPRRKAFMA